MTSFSTLCFSISILRLCGLVPPTRSCQAKGIDTSGGNFLWSLFISLFESIFMPVLLTRILLLYPFFFPIFKFRLLGSMYIPVPTQKSTFDNACSNTPWYFSMSIDKSSFINDLNVSLKSCWASTAGAELPTIVDLAWTWELRTRTKNLPCETFRLCNYPSHKVIRWRSFCSLYFMTKNTIICHIKPFSIHPCFIWINTILVTDTVICTPVVIIFNLAKAIFMW